MTARENDVKVLEDLCKELNEVTTKKGISLRVVEIKGTTFFFPQLPAEVSHG